MKNLFILAAAIVFILTGCQSSSPVDFSAIESGFVTPPDSLKTGSYWYWINDNISKEAVVEELQAMKQVGINRVYIGNIGLSPEEYPKYGKVEFLSDEWWDITHTAMKMAGELNIELGLFNCPGWSQSGGPWIKPEQAMRYLASSELRVKGPQKLNVKLKQPAADFQDVKVLAWQVPADYGKNLFQASGVQMIFSDSKIKNNPSAGNSTRYLLPEGDESYIGIALPQPTAARSLIIYPSGITRTDCELLAKKGNDFVSVKKFTIDRTNVLLNVGFEPLAPVAVSFPETESSEFRIVFRQTKKGSGIADIVLTPTPMVERFAEKTLAKMYQKTLPPWDEYMWIEQPEVKDASLLIDPGKVTDISQHLTADGTLTWDVPEGEWIIMRTGMTPTGVVNAQSPPPGRGLEVDKMNKKYVTGHFDAFFGEILKRIPAEDRKTWKVIVADSYETGSQNFTDGFIEEFKQRYGYDPVPYLPVYKGYTVGAPDLSDRFLWDMRRMVADKISYDYVGGLRDAGKPHGMVTWLENYGHWGFPGEFLQYGGQSTEISGEFWCEGNASSYENRLASSCAHTNGKNVVWSESFTSYGNPYGRHPATLKKRGDWSFTEGINNTMLHVNIMQPYADQTPGINTWFGTEFNRKNTWFGQMDLFITYLRRCNFMLQQGLNVADVAYFIGEDAPKMTGSRDPELPQGYSFDYINAEVILRDLSVKDGRLVLPHGTSYRMMVLPRQETMRPELLQKIEKLVADGAVILGPPPSRSPSMKNYPAADKQVQELAVKMWGDLSAKQRKYGKGTILTDMNMQEALDLLKVFPDCRFSEGESLLYAHRTLGNADIYFITNQSDHQIQCNPEFRVKGMQPELWSAVTGEMRTLPVFNQNGEITSVPLQLEPSESVFVVFRKSGKPSTSELAANYPQPTVVGEIDTPWEVRFESDEVKRGPAEPVIFERLSDWTENVDERIKYYSGTAVYKNTFPVKELPKNKKLYLDLGKPGVIAKVKINDQYVGGVWTPPYRIDVTKFVKEGDNRIEIETVNTWVNRLIGDLRLPEKDRRTWLFFLHQLKENSPLQPSGLTGTVKLVAIDN